MTIKQEISLDEFKAWSGAKYTMETLWQLDNLVSYDVFSQVESLIEDIHYDEPIGETELNDILWFETDWIAEVLDFTDWEELEKFVENDGKEPEEDEEED